MHRVVLLIALVVGAATPLWVIAASTVAAARAARGRAGIVLRMVAGVLVWASVSVFALFVTFVNVYSLAHTGEAYQHGRPNPGDVARVENFLAVAHAVYVVVCGLLAYYYLRLAESREEV